MSTKSYRQLLRRYRNVSYADVIGVSLLYSEIRQEFTIMGNAGTSTLSNSCAEMSLASVTDQSCGTDALFIWCHIKRDKYTMLVCFSINLRRPRGYLLFPFQGNMAKAAGIAGARICGT